MWLPDIVSCRYVVKRAAVTVAAALIACSLGGNAEAFEQRVFYPPLDLALLTYDPAIGCIGKAHTTLCAFETWYACLALSRPEFCEAVGVRDVTFSEEPTSFEVLRKMHTIEGRVGASRLRHQRMLSAPDEAALKRPLDWAKAGFVEIAFSYGYCSTPLFSSPDCVFEDEVSEWLFLKPVNGAWHIAGWIPEVGSVACEHYFLYDIPDVGCMFMIDDSEHWLYWSMIRRQKENDARYGVILTTEDERHLRVSRKLADQAIW